MDNELKEKPTNKKANMRDIILKYIDIILSLISFWLTIIIFVTFPEYITDLQWPYYGDQILIFISLLLVVNFTLDVLKPLIGLTLIVAIVFILFTVFNSDNPDEKGQTVDKINIANNLDFTRPFEVIETITIQNSLMKTQLDSLKIQLDLISKQLIEVKAEGMKRDSLQNLK
jgi:hypothetical protein